MKRAQQQYRKTIATIAACLLGFPHIAYAQQGASDFAQIFADVYNSLFPFIGVIGVLAIVIMGFRLVSSTDENAIQTSKTVIAVVVTGLFFAALTPSIFEMFYVNQLNGINTGEAVKAAEEVVGIAGWLGTIALIIGVLMVIVSSFRAVASMGSEEAASANRKSVLYGVIGLIIIGGTTVLHTVLFTERENPNVLITYIFTKVEIILGFILLIMVGILIYAGVILIANFGNESAAERAKGIVIRAVVGLILLLFSIAIVEIILKTFGVNFS